MQNAQRLDLVGAPACTISLSEMQSADQKLIATRQALLALTAEPAFDPHRFAHLRWQFSVAARERRSLVIQAYSELMPRLAPVEQECVRSIRALVHQALEALSSHRGEWPPAAVEADWPGYCVATQKLHASQKGHIEAEQRFLHTLLSKYA